MDTRAYPGTIRTEVAVREALADRGIARHRALEELRGEGRADAGIRCTPGIKPVSSQPAWARPAS
jgi:hypothetical protein